MRPPLRVIIADDHALFRQGLKSMLKLRPEVSVAAEVDCVSGVGWDRVPKGSERFHEIRRVVSNLAVMDFETPDHSMRLRSVHPGVTVDEVIAATGFELAVPDDVPETRLPSTEELRFIREVLDPDGLRNSEVKES